MAALNAAREHLDFCSVVGHAVWHDMPTDRRRYGHLIEYHESGFSRLAEDWTKIQQTLANYDRPGKFLPILGFEWHSMKYGDHNVYYPGFEGEIVNVDTVAGLKNAVAAKDALVIPHHIGYPTGYRGIDWDCFEPRLSPFVEMISFHGCSESDEAPYPIYHNMGPRSYPSTVQAGLRRGLRFGLVGGSDNHEGLPGSWGQGAMAVYARELTRESLWEAFKARRVYAVSGDRIALDLRINDAMMGSQLPAAATRDIQINVTGSDFLDHVELLKNERILQRWNGQDPQADQEDGGIWRGKIRIEYGWKPKEMAQWEAECKVHDGRIVSIERCFAGPRGTRPARVGVDGQEDASPPDQIIEQTEDRVAWRSQTVANASSRQPNTSALVLELEARTNARIMITMNGRNKSYNLSTLCEGSDGYFIDGWQGPAVRVHRAVPQNAYTFEADVKDPATGATETDCYRIRVAQRNGQWAWSSPVWIET